MAQRRRRVKFQPFRMTERFRNTILVGLGIFLMAIFAVPFQGACQRRYHGGRSPRDTYVVFDGRKIRYGDVIETRRLCHLIFRMQLTDEEAALRLAEAEEANRAGIRVPDNEVVDTIRNQIFPRRLKIEYAIAENRELGKDLSVSDKELDDAYARGKEKRFRRADGTYQPLSDVRETLAAELRAQKGAPLAKAAVEALRQAMAGITGAPLEAALKQQAAERSLRFGETRVFTARNAVGELRPIGDAPNIAQRVLAEPIGQISEPLPLEGGCCVFRVVMRSRGFEPDGTFYPEEEGWVRHGYGTLNIKSYEDVLDDMGVTQAELEATVRQDLMLVILPSVTVSALRDLPRATLVARYRRDNTQARAAYFALEADDFRHAVSYTEEQLREFYSRYKGVTRTETTPGYRQPERVRIEYVLGRTADVAQRLTDAEARSYYERNRAFFGASFDEARDKVRLRLAEDKLQDIVTNMANRAADDATTRAEPDLAAVAAHEGRQFPDAFEVRATRPFAADEAEIKNEVPQLAGAKLADMLFGERGQQYAVAGAERKPGTHVISEVLASDTGRFFFRVLQRIEPQDIPYDGLPEETKRQLIRDVLADRAFAAAKEKAEECRAEISEAALARFAECVGTKVLDTEFLKPDSPIPTLGKPAPELYDQLARAEVGEMSQVVETADRFVLARLAERKEIEGHRLQLVSLPKDKLEATYEPSLYRLRGTYDSDPYAYLDPPKAIPFDEVKADIEALLARRQALKLATERAEKALAELVGADKPDLAAVAAKHGLQVTPGVAVDLSKPEAAPHIGRAAGFRDAVTALKPGDLSRIVASAEGRFLFVVKARTDDAATLDVAAALYDPIRSEVKIDEKNARQYYDDHRDTAYLADTELKDAPSWDTAPAAAQDRVRAQIKDLWAKKAPLARLAELRDSLVEDAFRSVPSATALAATREVDLRVQTLGPFAVSRPEGLLANEPEAMAAIAALKPGELSQPLPTRDGALLARVAERRPGGLARAKVAIFRVADFLESAPNPEPAAIERHFEADPEAFRIPEQATVEFMLADLAPRQAAIRAKLSDAECRRHFDQRADLEYRGLDYEQAEYRVRTDLARERAAIEARSIAERALASLRTDPKPAESDLAALAKKFELTYGRTQPFAIQDPADVPGLGRVPSIAGDLREARPGHVVPRVVEAALGPAVCRVVGRTASRLPTLEEARDRVAAALKLEAARAAARKAAEALRTAATDAAALDKAAAQATPAPRVVETELLSPHRFTVPGEGTLPGLSDAVFALDKPGLTQVVAEADPERLVVALVTERQPEEEIILDAVALSRAWFFVPHEPPPDEELRKHYEANKQSYHAPERVQVEYLAASYDELGKSLTATDDEMRAEYDRSVKAGESTYRDMFAPRQPAYLPFEKVKDIARRRVLKAKARPEADKLLAAAMKDLQAAGDKADFTAYAAKHAPLAAAQTELFDREKKGTEQTGPTPDLAPRAFAAKKGEFAGPIAGDDGACIIRLIERRPAGIQPFDDVRAQVRRDLERKQDVERAVAALAKFRETLAAALAKADEAERRQALRRIVEAEPLAVEVPRHLIVTLSEPFYPLGAGWGKSSFITGLGVKEALVHAIFRQPPGTLTRVVEEADHTACYVALPTRFIAPEEPTDSSLFETQYRLYDETRRLALNSWRYYLATQMERP